MPGERQPGAYGFRLVCDEAPGGLPGLGSVEIGAPTVSISWRQASATSDWREVREHSISLALERQGLLILSRDPPSVLGSVPEVWTLEALVHPLLTFPLALHAHWRGDTALHAGAFEAAGAAWIVLGHKKAGKSTLLATLAGRGVPIVADDLVVVRDGRVLAGPESVDLRPDAAVRFPKAHSMGIVAGFERFRLPTPQAQAPALALGGIFILGWHESPGVSVTPLDPAMQLGELNAQHYGAMIGPPHPRDQLDLLTYPTVRVLRDRAWPRMEDTIGALSEVIGSDL